jgi:histidinol-phosphate aminotransferase
MNKLLKLDFNERNDKPSQIDSRYNFERSLSLYPDRERLEKRLADLNAVQLEQVFATNGGDEAIGLLMRIIKESAQYILPLPAFSQYLWGIDSWQLQGQKIAAKADLSIDIEKTQEAITSSPNSVVILTSPNNPTGELISEADLINLLTLAKQNNSWVLLDNAYIEFSANCANIDAEAERVNSLLNQFDNLVILKTLSKAYGLAGIRLGYLLGSKQALAPFKQRAIPFNVSQPTIEIAVAAIESSNQNEVFDYCQQVQENRQQLLLWCQQNKIQTLPSQANFLMLQLPSKQAQAIASFLKRNNIFVKTFVEPTLIDCLRVTIPYDLDGLFALLKQALTPSLLCFDMDGVLIDTSDSYDASIKATVAFYSDKTVEQSEIDGLKLKGGFNNDWQVTQECLKVRGIKMSLEEVTAKFQQLYLGDDNNVTNGFVKNEISFVNTKLKNALNNLTTPVAIVTGRPKIEAQAGVELVGLSVNDVISLDDVVVAKPSPEGINKLKQKYQATSWMCGDNVDDMQAAISSNSVAIGIGMNNAEALYQAGADIVFESINQLEAWLCPIK